MIRYDAELRHKIITLRSGGYTYTEICALVGQEIPKASLSYICRNTQLGPEQKARILQLMRERLVQNRVKAVAANKKILADKIAGYRASNLDLLSFMADRRAKLVALAMLYLGEGAKWKGKRGLMLGSSNPDILRLYIALLRDCYAIPIDALRGRIQHRADQDPDQLLAFWSEALGVAPANFYKPYVDKRTIGQVSKHPEYKGVCSITCAGTHIQLELEQITGIICGAI